MQEQSAANVKLTHNEYPGRGLIIGATPDGKKLVQVYWIMGRSENSQNRIFVLENNVLKTTSFDPSKCEDPSLIVYNAMQTLDNMHVVTNGDQTDTIITTIKKGGTFKDALATRTFEPDAPHYTPRISGIIIYKDQPTYKINILKTLHNNPNNPENRTFSYSHFTKGMGHCIHTYEKNGNPLPSFSGEPFAVPIKVSIEETADYYWNVLDEKNRISLAVKSIDHTTKEIDYTIINKLG